MKKKILLSTTFFAVVALAVTVNINLNSHKAQSALTLANIEALARNHGGGGDGSAIHCLTNSEYNSNANGQTVCIRYHDGTKHCRWHDRVMPPLKGPADYNCD